MNKIITLLVIFFGGAVLAGCTEMPVSPNTTAAQETGASENAGSPTFADAQNIARLCYDLAVSDEDNLEALLSQGFTRETRGTLRRNVSVWEYSKGTKAFRQRYINVRKSAGLGGSGCTVELLWLSFDEANSIYQNLQERLRNNGFVINVRRVGLVKYSYFEKGSKRIMLNVTDYNGGITFRIFDANDED